MEPIIYIILFLGILMIVSILSNKLKVNPFFNITIFFQGSIYLASSVWEAQIWYPGHTCSSLSSVGPFTWFSIGIWWLVYGLIAVSFIIFYIMTQSNILDSDFSKIDWKNTIMFSVLVVGNILFFGVLEDFGCYVIWGVGETFGPDLYAGHIHGAWIGGLPVFYLSAIPGIIMVVMSLWYSRKIPKHTINS